MMDSQVRLWWNDARTGVSACMRKSPIDCFMYAGPGGKVPTSSQVAMLLFLQTKNASHSPSHVFGSHSLSTEYSMYRFDYSHRVCNPDCLGSRGLDEKILKIVSLRGKTKFLFPSIQYDLMFIRSFHLTLSPFPQCHIALVWFSKSQLLLHTSSGLVMCTNMKQSVNIAP